MSDLESVDALIAAAKKSLKLRRGNDVVIEPEKPAAVPDPRSLAELPPLPAPSRTRTTPELPDGVADAVTAAVAAALQGLSFDSDPAPLSMPPVEDGDLPEFDDPDLAIALPPSKAPDTPGPVDAAAELESPAPSTGSRFDLVDGLIGRIDAAVKFVGSHERHGYDREPTTQLLKEASQSLRRVREKRDDNQKQMERWFLQWRSSEAKSLEMLTELKRLTALQEQQTGLLVMARRYAVQGDVCVEWRDKNSWVIILDEYILNLSKQWEPDVPGSTDPDYLARTRFTLSDAITRARGLRVISNS